jgi:hypothetical protein
MEARSTMPRHKRSYGYLFCGRLRLSKTKLGEEMGLSIALLVVGVDFGAGDSWGFPFAGR